MLFGRLRHDGKAPRTHFGVFHILFILGAISCSTMAQSDTFKPTLTVVTKALNTWTLLATDNKPTEDANGNGILDNNEDTNGNGLIDKDTGISTVALQAGSTNLRLNVPSTFKQGDSSVQFTVDRITSGQAGSGTVIVTDGTGNTVTTAVNFPSTTDTLKPVLTVLTRGLNTWNLQATDNKPSEDTNANGILDNNEDTNGNGLIDQDMGISSVTLQAGNTNLRLNVPSTFKPGDPSVQFTVDRVTLGQAGSGTIIVTDQSGNTATTAVNFGSATDTFKPVCTVVRRSLITWTLQATDNKPSEDTNGNGQLDTNEDTNGNGLIDEDRGISSVILQSGSTNLRLNIPSSFQPGDPLVQFTVDRVDTSAAGGTILVTDTKGNGCRIPVRFSRLVDVVDTFKPVLTVLSRGLDTWTLRATDKKPSEDVNGNGRLDNYEDRNGNGIIDEDTGISSVELETGSTNLQLNVPSSFQPGDPSVQFTVDRVDTEQAGSGTVIVTDQDGNTATTPVNFASTTDTFRPVCTVVRRGLITWTLYATDNKASEDVNGNGQLDNNEDRNGNGLIDQDTGISTVTLQAGSTNLRLNVPASFQPGDHLIQFTVDRIDSSAGGGTVLVTDTKGNDCTIPVRFSRLVDLDDTFKPVCTVLTRGQDTWTLRATDNKPSEDINGNGRLDNNEDRNGNGLIDDDTGISSVEIQSGSTNVQLNVPSSFDSGDPSVVFTVDRVSLGQAGSGTVLVADGAGNTCTLLVSFPVPPDSRNDVDSFNPLCSVLTRGRSKVRARATDNRRGEDVNRNGRLDPNEDTNGNGRVDKDRGIKSVVLKRGSSNVRLNVPRFVRGAASVDFTVERANSRRNSGRGTVLVTDVAGRTCTVPVRFSCKRRRGSNRCRSNWHGFVHSTGRKASKKKKRALRGSYHS